MTLPSKEPRRHVTGTVKSRARVMGHPVVPGYVKIAQGMVVDRDTYEYHIARTMSENTWREHIRGLAKDAGWTLQYHTYNSQRSDPGWMDDVLYHQGLNQVIFMEAKRQAGKLSYWQVVWLDALAKIRDATNSGRDRIRVYGGVRPMDRANLVVTLLGAQHVDKLGHPIPPLHEWCLSHDCVRCNDERSKATPYKPPERGRRRDKTHRTSAPV